MLIASSIGACFKADASGLISSGKRAKSESRRCRTREKTCNSVPGGKREFYRPTSPCSPPRASEAPVGEFGVAAEFLVADRVHISAVLASSSASALATSVGGGWSGWRLARVVSTALSGSFRLDDDEVVELQPQRGAPGSRDRQRNVAVSVGQQQKECKYLVGACTNWPVKTRLAVLTFLHPTKRDMLRHTLLRSHKQLNAQQQSARFALSCILLKELP